jgi:fatty acid desaturase
VRADENKLDFPKARAFADVVREQHLTEPDAVYSTFRLIAFLGSWPALYFLARALDNPISWVAIWVLQGLIFEGCNIGVHEAGHGNLYRRRSANFLAGTLFSLPILYNFAPYRAAHLEHHQFTHVPGRDSEPDHQERNLAEYFAYIAFSGVLYTFVLLFEGLQAVAGRGRKWKRSGRRRQLALLSTVVLVAEFVLIAIGFAEAPRVVFELWLMPYLISAMWFAPMVTHAEHTGCAVGPASPFVTTRTTFSNRVVSFFIWNINYHTAHHLVPSIPGQKLPTFQPHIARYCQNTSRSYSAWHGRFALTLVRGRVATAVASEESGKEPSSELA